MAKKVFTSISVKNHKPGKKRREVPDAGCPGLFLVIQPSGHKSWAMRFRLPSGQPAKLTLGTVDLSGKEPEGAPAMGTPLTLLGARTLAADVHRQRAIGRDPVADYAAAKIQKSLERSEAFGVAARDFIEQYASK